MSISLDFCYFLWAESFETWNCWVIKEELKIGLKVIELEVEWCMPHLDFPKAKEFHLLLEFVEILAQSEWRFLYEVILNKAMLQHHIIEDSKLV